MNYSDRRMSTPGIGVRIVAEGYWHKEIFFLVFNVHWPFCEQAQDVLPNLGCETYHKI